MANLSGEISIGTGQPSNVLSSSTNQLAVGQGLVFGALTNAKSELFLPTGLFINTLANLSSYLQFTQLIAREYKLPLARLFGSNARQDATKIYINKADLEGLTSAINNSAESLLIALLMTAMKGESSYNSRIDISERKPYFVKVNLQNYSKLGFQVLLLVPVSYVNIGSNFSELNFEITNEASDTFIPNRF